LDPALRVTPLKSLYFIFTEALLNSADALPKFDSCFKRQPFSEKLAT
jgi:hypothetical protein